MTKEIIFTLPAEALENATEGLLLGDFNNWDADKGIVLKKQEDGSLNAVVQLEAGKTYQYRFLLNDGRWVNDYHAQNYVPVSGFHIENALITVPETLDIEQSPEISNPETTSPIIVKSKTVKPKIEKVKVEKVGKAKVEKAKTEKPKAEKVKAEKVKTVKVEKKEVIKKKK